jgi:glycerol-3-phosphate acyltransferase PlsY
MWTISCYQPETPNHVRAATLLLAAYAYGSLPIVYLLARRRGINLQEVGSGNVGATALWTAAGTSPAVCGWLADASKGMLPVLVAHRLQLGEDVAALAGVTGMAGQCWPVFLRFSGGRGISAFVGASLAIDPRSAMGSFVFMAAGSAWRVLFGAGAKGRSTAQILRTSRSSSVPLGCLLGVLTFPWLCRVTNPGRRFRFMVTMLLPLIIGVRRLTAALPDDPNNGPAVEPKARLYRLLFDRNTRW